MTMRWPRSRLLLAVPALALAGMIRPPARSTADEPAPRPPSFPVNITVDASREKGPLSPIWRFFGADEPNYAYMKDGRKLLGELGGLRPRSVYFRTHNLLTSGDGTPALKWGSTGAYSESAVSARPNHPWRGW
jgi:xylan 1,4-beta-xylosidase